MDERQQLLAAIEDFCEREGMAPTTFGRKALGDGRFTGRLRDGRQVRAATLARVRQFLADHDPAASARTAPRREPRPAGRPSLRETTRGAPSASTTTARST